MDAIDHQILALLTADARRPVADIAAEVGLSPAPVKRRIDRMERDGVIQGYTTVVDYAATGVALEAFIEIRVLGSIDTGEVWADLQVMPEVVQMLTIAGDPDAWSGSGWTTWTTWLGWSTRCARRASSPAPRP